MKLLSLLSASVLLLHTPASALTITIDAAILRDQFGNAMGQSGVVVLAASTLDATFNGPYGSAFVTGDDIVLGTWDLSLYGIDGLFSATTELYFSDFGGDWGTDDPLQLFWFPDLTLSGPGPVTPSAGMSYGTYSDAVGVDGSAPWITPAESDLISLGFFTNDAPDITIEGQPYPFVGSNTFEDASATYLVAPTGNDPSSVPDTGGTLWLFSASLAGLTAIRRFRGRLGRRATC